LLEDVGIGTIFGGEVRWVMALSGLPVLKGLAVLK